MKPPFNPDAHHRRSIRLKAYDYSTAGAYFVTIVTQERLCLFGDVADGEAQLTDAGVMIQQIWHAIPDRFPTIEMDEFVVMPNHVHGILIIHSDVGASLVGAQEVTHTKTTHSPVGASLVGAQEVTHTTTHSPVGASLVGAQEVTHTKTTHSPVGASLVGALPADRARSTDGGRATTRVAPTEDGPMTLGEVVGAYKSLTTHQYGKGVETHGWPPFNKRLWQRNYYERVIRDARELDKAREYIANNPMQWELDAENPSLGTPPTSKPSP